MFKGKEQKPIFTKYQFIMSLSAVYISFLDEAVQRPLLHDATFVSWKQQTFARYLPG
jgi:hypothetical protein